jgi:phosphorylcholine metabolism protein LicD
MTSLAILKKLIKLFEKNKIRYWVFGGFALDGIRGEISRLHNDIDIYLYFNDLEKTLNLLKFKSLEYYKRKNMYFVESDKVKLGIIILTEKNIEFIANGNKTLVSYPKKIFSEDNYVSLKGIIFRIAPNEVLTVDSKFSKFNNDKLFGAKLEINEDLFNKIKVVKVSD